MRVHEFSLYKTVSNCEILGKLVNPIGIVFEMYIETILCVIVVKTEKIHGTVPDTQQCLMGLVSSAQGMLYSFIWK